jgi:hypothetical protein
VISKEAQDDGLSAGTICHTAVKLYHGDHQDEIGIMGQAGTNNHLEKKETLKELDRPLLDYDICCLQSLRDTYQLQHE